jgi:hypothetical protein
MDVFVLLEPVVLPLSDMALLINSSMPVSVPQDQPVPTYKEM